MSGCHTIGEPEWKPHNCNVETNPNALIITNKNDVSVIVEVQKNSSSADVSNVDIDETEELSREKKYFEALDPSNFEWTYYSDGSKHGKRCHFDGQFIGNNITTDEVQLEHTMGTRSKVEDPRGGLPCVALGDKNYSVPEFSSDFHKEGSTLPAVNFSRTTEPVTETFIPLQQLSTRPSATYFEKEKERVLIQEKEEVKALDKWSPAKPMAAGF